MNFPAGLFPSDWYSAGWLPLLPALAWSMRTAQWRRLAESAQLNVWLGTIVALVVLWSMKAGVQPGLDFHVLGAAAFVLMFGPQLATIGMCIVLAAVTFNGSAAWSAYALNAIVMVLVPVATAHAVLRLAERRLPNHFFIYIFFDAFLGAALTIVATGLAATLLMATVGIYSADYLLSQYLPFIILLGFSEATLTGMCLTILVVYRPAWVGTFDDARYLLNK
jgi:uncharacterized membrane protein